MGLLIGTNRYALAVTRPLLNFYRPLPPLAYYTLLIVAFGIGETSKIFLLFLTAIPTIVIATEAGARSVRTEFMQGARSLGASKWQVFRLIMFPAAMPQIITGLRLSLAITYTTLVAAEMVAATSGIGWMVLQAAQFLQTPIIYLGIIVMGITGLLLDVLMRWAERRLVPWVGKSV
ncbi:ABC transporter permease [Pseudarthrobacter sp. AB1]|uniref:ABC transporter permease n=1 Tax=Pseudarthrobacter sp. AB1 TaxID=2138309 RepID=UPI00186B92A1|nr:ABC transporter permease [Pseudarthrobacter sp. AB1]